MILLEEQSFNIYKTIHSAQLTLLGAAGIDTDALFLNNRLIQPLGCGVILNKLSFYIYPKKKEKHEAIYGNQKRATARAHRSGAHTGANGQTYFFRFLGDVS